MSYMALYRKWRPDDFQEVKGQEHIVTTLKNQIKYDRIGHAYLFCGTRGTGKTTIAKLLAKAVNCEHPIEGSPCNECESCKSIAAGNSMNVIEIDAASNNSVDNIRQINNSVQYSPQAGKKLVYIIDEVHMLSTSAFNALLKTLEEPPEYVIFILATTEAHKVPVTINSRCQRYDFRRISIETIANRLADLLERENIPATKEALAYVAKAADGSMRDALSILDQCIAFNLGEELTYDKVLDTIGAVDVEVYIELFKAVSTGDVEAAVDLVDRAVWQGKDLVQLVNEFTAFIRNVLMLKLNPNMTVDLTSENTARLIELGREVTEGYLINYINILQEAAGKLAGSATKRIMLEVAIIKMCKPSMQHGYDAIEKRMDDMEKRLEQRLAEGSNQVIYVNSTEVPDGVRLSENARHEAPGVDRGESEMDEGKRVIENIKKKYDEATAREILMIINSLNEYKDTRALPTTKRYLDKVMILPGEEPSTLDLVIVNGQDSIATNGYFNPDNIRLLEEELSEFADREIHLVVRKVTEQEAKNPNITNFNCGKIHFDKIDYKF